MEVTLANESLWKEFSEHMTEMIVTKPGRKMFPKLEFSVKGLDPDVVYAIVLQMEQVDKQRYKFSGGEWATAGRGEESIPRVVGHHDGGMRGSQWMRAPIVFERLKITNNPADHNQSHVFLHSMHKYRPVLSIYEVSCESALAPTYNPKQVKQFRLPCTEFIAVTAYQNERIKSLKITHNPFARGFRDGGERKRSGSRDSPSDSSEPSPKRTPPLAEQLPLPVVSPMWYSHIFSPYLMNPMLSPYPYRFTFPRTS